MKIGFDGKRITQNFTGLGNYSRYVLQVLAKHHPENQYQVFAATASEASEGLQKFSSIEFKYPEKHFSKSYWRSFGIVRNLEHEEIELYHGLSNEIPFGLKKKGIPSVVSIHDLIFYRYPQYYPWFDRKIYEYKMRYAADHAAKIIAISETTKKDLINLFNVEQDRIEVIYQNCDPVFRINITDTEKQRIRSAYNLPEKYLLNVGTIETRKNSLLAVQAIRKLDTDIQLIIIGKDTPYAEKLREFTHKHGLNKRVHFLKNVSFNDLPGIYQMADVFLFPSEYEGFGIPVIEALSSGVPVIAATGSCLEEAGGAGSIYVDHKDSEALRTEILNVLKNPEKRQNMIKAGFEHLEKFSDQKIAGQLNKLYQNIIKC
ncbi:MAG: glycosyltransferase family 1 protein [Daejeonella sp.]|uniref:glycosyltransferase family 4 protein n=1 Tax=Daejeonella sp. TaxID=2805397 RepID=UPI00273753EF|nr:glycosyltransferase family 1 protein [Daejeonella sp.]MDP3467444.1 glycosyltransferase family 1 protein [Daejeonella sp.]